MIAARAPGLLALGLALALGPGAAAAQPYDPDYRWRTLETPRFRVHFHQGEEALAQKVAREAERAHLLLAPRLGHDPGRTELVLSDDRDDANGMATPVPYNLIRLLMVPPDEASELQDYRDWLRTLVQHEYTHVLHLDNVSGLPWLVNSVFGKLWPPNALTPSFVAEGVAVVHEAEGDPAAGRNASALFDMQARALALDGPFPRLDEASNPPLFWPTGQIPYLLGGRFMGFLQARFGVAAVAGFFADQGGAIWPWAPSWAAERWFGGLGFPELWEQYAAAERAYAEGRRAAVRQRPVTPAARLTRLGGLAGRPRFSPDGTFLLYWQRGLDERPGIRKVTPDGRDLGRVADVDANGALALAAPGEAVVAVSEVFHEFRQYDDLWRLDLATGARRRLTEGERATDPDVGRDGTLVYVRHTGGGATALVRRRPGAEPEVLFTRAGADLYAPRLGPDGRIAFELHEGGRRDLALWAGGEVTRVTDDDALDTAPAWTPDGRWLLFASDRGGIVNLYAWEAATGTLRQVTNVELGAYAPDVSPDGRTIAFLGYSRDGWDVARMPFDPAAWLDPPPAPPVVPFPPPATAAEAALPDPIPSRPYSAWPTVRPAFWLPVLSTDGAGSVYGALTAGTDALARHAWSAQGWWSEKGREPGYALGYQGGWSWPRLDLSSSLSLAGSPGPPYRLQREWEYASVGATFTWTRLAWAFALRAGWSATGYESVKPIPAFPARFERYRFHDGLLSEGSLLAKYTDARRFVHSISPEEGRTLSLTVRVAEPELGSTYALARAKGSAAQYLRVPYTRHAVLALRAAGGVADGTIGGRAPFELGGLTLPDPLSLVPGSVTAPSDTLRGYPVGALGGTGYVLGNVELRTPIVAPGRGRSTWPVFLRRLHAALFADVGDAFDLPRQLPLAGHPLSVDQLRASVGGELRLELALAYYLVTDVRFGVARPLGAVFGKGRAADLAEGVDLSPAVFYLTVGPSF